MNLIGRTFKIKLRDTQTGEVRLCPGGTWRDGSRFGLMEGNDSCDCNRENLFREGKKVPDDGVCGEKRYTLEGVVFDADTPEENEIRPEALE